MIGFFSDTFYLNQILAELQNHFVVYAVLLMLTCTYIAGITLLRMEK